ncbi:fumarylacetoacetate hydrolase family protein [Saccharicrinis sp. FJH2]|uniref:fumarylacetoacetate hydrolase family protein n=1 Tax=Saccharicrinis sp. FJH65 TaxID=3344659 RepID=UPI0035F4C5F7
MKLICVGKNYAKHVKELHGEVPEEPVLFIKPDSAILKNGSIFYLPSFSNEVHHEIEILVKINRLGKNIEQRFAHRYYDEIGLGIDFTARDLQAELKKKGLPWAKAKCFDGSAPIGDFVPLSKIGGDINNIEFHLEKNGETVQKGNTADMLFKIDELIAYISTFFTLKIGDIIYTGTPEGVGPVKPDDQLIGFIGEKQLLKIGVK